MKRTRFKWSKEVKHNLNLMTESIVKPAMMKKKSSQQQQTDNRSAGQVCLWSFLGAHSLRAPGWPSTLGSVITVTVIEPH